MTTGETLRGLCNSEANQEQPFMPKKPNETKDKTGEQVITIKPINMVVMELRIRGTAPFVQEAFSGRTAAKLAANMATAKADKPSKKDRPPRDYEQEFQDAQHKSVAGWIGIPCGGFRRAMVDACRAGGVQMTTAKLAVFIRPDGFDQTDGTPLVRLDANDPEETRLPVRNANGVVDIRVRPMWRQWGATVSIEFDADLISPQSVVNLLDRAGRQVGIGAGRPFSKQSTGMGWGTFVVEQKQEKAS